MNKTRIRLLVVTLIASVMALTGLVLAPSQTFAKTHGTNGQTVQVCLNNLTVPAGQGGVNVTVVGMNERNPSQFVMTPEFHLGDGQCASTSTATPGFPLNYYYIGTVGVIVNHTTYMQCQKPVPASQPD